jgi:hypothetical protein
VVTSPRTGFIEMDMTTSLKMPDPYVQ